MERRFWNKTVILDIASIVSNLAALGIMFIPQRGEDKMTILNWQSPQGILVIALIATSVVLVIIGIFLKDTHLSFNDKKALIQERSRSLAELRSHIDSRLRAAQPLMNKAERLPLLEYWKMYLKNTYPYIVTRQTPKTPLEIANALRKHNFLWNNEYYGELKEQDGNYKRVLNNYHMSLAKVDRRSRKILTPSLNGLWRLEHWSNSCQIFGTISMKNKGIPNTPTGYSGGLKGKHMAAGGFQTALTDVQNKIGELMRGEDL